MNKKNSDKKNGYFMKIIRKEKVEKSQKRKILIHCSCRSKSKTSLSISFSRKGLIYACCLWRMLIKPPLVKKERD